MINVKKSTLVIFLVLASAFLSLFTLEVILRLKGETSMLEVDWILKPGEESWVKDSETIFIHENIYLELDKLSSVGDDKPIIILIGDSYTSGEPRSEIWSYDIKLKELIQDSGRNVEVINLGVAGFSPDQEWVLLKKALKKNKNVVAVVWQFYNNDVYDNYLKPLYSIKDNNLINLSASDHWIYKRQKFYDLIPLDRETKFNSHILNRLLYFMERDKHYVLPHNFIDYSEFSLKKISLQLSEVRKFSEEYGFDLLLPLVAPQAIYTDMESEPIKLTLSEFNSLKPVLESQEGYINVEITVGSNSANIIATDYFSNETQDPLPFGLRHFNKKGYDFMAETIFENLVSTSSSFINIK